MARARVKKYSREAQSEIVRLKKQYERSISQISEGLAGDDETVQLSHVQHANRVFSFTPNRPSFLKRRETRTAIGSSLATGGISIAGISFTVFPPKAELGMFWIWVVAIPLALFLVGAFFVMHGWLAPEKPPE
jgi:hypothetical protein